MQLFREFLSLYYPTVSLFIYFVISFSIYFHILFLFIGLISIYLCPYFILFSYSVTHFISIISADKTVYISMIYNRRISKLKKMKVKFWFEVTLVHADNHTCIIKFFIFIYLISIISSYAFFFLHMCW